MTQYDQFFFKVVIFLSNNLLLRLHYNRYRPAGPSHSFSSEPLLGRTPYAESASNLPCSVTVMTPKTFSSLASIVILSTAMPLRIGVEGDLFDQLSSGNKSKYNVVSVQLVSNFELSVLWDFSVHTKPMGFVKQTKTLTNANVL